MNKEAGWFVLYNKYSVSNAFDKAGLKKFEEDAKLLSRSNVKHVIIEDYPEGLHYGGYTKPWNGETLSGMVAIAHKLGMKVYPYLNPVLVSQKILEAHPGWARIEDGKRHCGFSTYDPVKYYYWNDIETMCTEIVCPAVEDWRNNLLGQTKEILATYSFDGIYLDYVMWKWRCDEHSIDENCAGLARLVRGLHDVAKAANQDNKVIINDYFYCRPPGAAMQDLISKQEKVEFIDMYKDLGLEVLQHADIILTENCAEWGLEKTVEIIERVHATFPGKPVLFTRHWDDWKGLATLKLSYDNIARTGESICYFFPFPLVEFLEDTKESLALLTAGCKASK